MELTGRIAVVTGAGDGMGRQLVHQLLASGANVAAIDISEAGLADTKATATADGVRLTTHVVDVSDEQQLIAAAADIRAQHQTDHVHLLFNNAGIGGGGSMFTDDRATWERTFNIDWGGVYLGVRTFLPLLVAADQARIVNTSSVNGFWASLGPRTPHTSYSAAKFAVKGFTEALITDLHNNAPHVTCAVVMPGHIGTGIVANSRKVFAGNGSDQLSAAELAGARARMAAAGVDVDRFDDADIQQFVDDRARQFAEKAPMTAAQAARVILDGVRADQWRILVGDDAHELDRRVRNDPESAYSAEFHESFSSEVGWGLGGL